MIVVADTSVILNLALVGQAELLAVLFRDLGHGKVKVSFRSLAGVNVNTLARSFGGGGHARASGALVAGSLLDVEARVLGEARHQLESGALAD